MKDVFVGDIPYVVGNYTGVIVNTYGFALSNRI